MPESHIKRMLLDRIRRGEIELPSVCEPFAAPADVSCLAPVQEPIWLEDQLVGPGAAQTIAIAYRVHGSLDEEALERAVAAIVDRHDALRTRITVRDGSPMSESCDRRIALKRTSGTGDDTADLLRDFANEPIDSSTGPLCRFLLIRETAAQYVFAIAVHHVVADERSLSIFVDELSDHYGRFAGHHGGDPPDEPAPYAQYAATAGRVQPEKLARAVDLFRDRLRTAPVLGVRHSFDANRAKKAKTIRHRVDADLRSKVERFASARRMSRFIPLLAAFELVRCRFDDLSETVVGVPVGDHRRTGFEKTIGCFVNTVPVRTTIAGDPSFELFTTHVARAVAASLSHADVPFGAVARQLEPWVRSERRPLFRTLFVLHDGPLPRPVIRGARVECVDVDTDATTATLACTVRAHDAGFSVELRYDAEAFDAATIDGLLGAFVCALDAAVSSPELPVSRIPLLTAAQARDAATIDDVRTRPLDPVFPDAAFEIAARNHAGNSAVECGDERLTYGEVSLQVNALARALRSAIDRHGARVAVLVERSAALPVALLAALRAGVPYVPLDQRHPLPYLRSILATIGVDAVLHSPSLFGRARELAPNVPTVSTAARFGSAPSSEPWEERSGESPAYVIATSGSTGAPKGVVISHSALANVIASFARFPGFGASHAMLAATTVTFDIAALELLLPLTAGGRLVVATDEEATDPWALAAVLDRSDATHLQGTPSQFRSMIASGWRGAGTLQVWVGGEPLPPALAAQLRERVADVYNVYGPTETTIWSTAGRVDDPAAVTVGEPIDNTRVFVLDRHGEIVPFGARGQIAIAGRGVALGYVGNEAAARARFVEDRFSPGGGTLFLTGDNGSRMRDGRIVLYGRSDDQVKVRGFRLDLGDVDARLSELPGVSAAAACTIDGPNGDPALVGHLVTAEPFEPERYFSWLRAHVPRQMIPAALVLCRQLPLTPNGKVDRDALRRRDVDVPRGNASPLESDERTRFITTVFEEVLNRRGVTSSDGLFDLGGSSIDAVRILARVRAEFGVEIPLSVLLTRASSVAMLADEVLHRQASSVDEKLLSLIGDVEGLSDDDVAHALSATPRNTEPS